MALIVDSICRYQLKGTLDGSLPADVTLDVSITVPGGTAAQRQAQIQATGKNLLDAWVADVMPQLAQDYSFNEIYYVDLDSSSGTTGTITSSSTNTLPKSGSSSITGSLPAQVATLVTKNTTSGRGQRNGRMFMPGTPSTQVSTSGNGPLPAYASNLNTKFAALLSAVSAATNPIVVIAAVVHEKSSSWTPITSMAVQPLFGTQRRRLRP